jgi:hypothetical protein
MIEMNAFCVLTPFSIQYVWSTTLEEQTASIFQVTDGVKIQKKYLINTHHDTAQNLWQSHNFRTTNKLGEKTS